MKQINLVKLVYTSSLRIRLTLGIAALSALSMGGLAMWTSWKMQHILISTHQQNMAQIAERFPHDVEIYSQMMEPEIGLQMAIDNVTTDNIHLWVRATNGNISARSNTLQPDSKDSALLSLTVVKSIPELQEINGRYWLLSAGSLEVQQVQLGKLYIAQDITTERTMFLSIIGSITIASLLFTKVIIIAIALYVYKSLQPLQRLSQLTAKISPERLGEVRIELNNAPREVQELAETFDEMLSRLTSAWEHQRQLASNLSHELRTPLTLVSGYLQSTLRRGDNLTETQREALTIAASEAGRIVTMLQDLLDVARADNGTMHFQLSCLVLKDLVQEVVEMTRQGTNRHLRIESNSDPIAIKADEMRLKQVLVNLLDNAIKYSVEGEEPVTVKIDKQGDRVILAVSDGGIGIPLAEQTRIFDRFYRVDEARTRTTGGTGLGLSIVKTLVEGMGGSISVRSQPGAGSTFTIIFPVCRVKYFYSLPSSSSSKIKRRKREYPVLTRD